MSEAGTKQGTPRRRGEASLIRRLAEEKRSRIEKEPVGQQSREHLQMEQMPQGLPLPGRPLQPQQTLLQQLIVDTRAQIHCLTRPRVAYTD